MELSDPEIPKIYWSLAELSKEFDFEHKALRTLLKSVGVKGILVGHMLIYNVQERDKAIEAYRLHQTGWYTYKGIKHFLWNTDTLI